jgi:endonuclease/exonuclease/phosphatase family metal-dependent hydrolase
MRVEFGVMSCGCRLFPAVLLAVLCCVMFCGSAAGYGERVQRVRVATFNCSLNRNEAGLLAKELAGGESVQGRQIARILRQVRPDIVLLNEFDFAADGLAVAAFCREYLESEGAWAPEPPLVLGEHFQAPVNTGEPSGRDFDQDGRMGGPADAIGFGRFPGQYGMLVLSRFPIRLDRSRTFQRVLWKDMPGALLPINPKTNQPWYSAADLEVLRLSSKSHWDVSVQLPGLELHVLASHPTPPAFDGEEDRNGCRNHDEIRFWADYLGAETSDWIRDDAGRAGGLEAGAAFVILGDLNADPLDGGSRPGAIQQLLDHRGVNAESPGRSAGAGEAAVLQQGRNREHRGNAEEDTADFSDSSVGNLRVDYVLPSRGLRRVGGGVFWPRKSEAGADLIECSDHRLVWVDLEIEDAER